MRQDARAGLAQQAYSTPYEDFTEAMRQKLTLGDQGPDCLASVMIVTLPGQQGATPVDS